MPVRVVTLVVSALLSFFLLAQTAPVAEALPVAPAAPSPVEGVPQPCTPRHTWPAKASMQTVRKQLSAAHGVKLTGDMWNDPAYRDVVRLIWQGLDAVSCTDFLPTVMRGTRGRFHLHAAHKSSWAWGDWSNTKSYAVTLDFAKLKTAVADDPGRVVRLLIHEIAHAWMSAVPDSATRGYASLHQRYGMFSNYGGSSRETFSEVVGYYVARCADKNPYNGDQPTASDAEASAYYAFVRARVFNGVEFAAAPGEKVNCSLRPTRAPAKEPTPDPVALPFQS